MAANALRALPAVEKVLQHEALASALAELGRPLVVEAVRATLADARTALRAKKGSPPDIAALALAAAARAREESRPLLRRVLNGTGIVLHTNLGRAPLALPAQASVAQVAAGYSSLEFDLASGKRGDRGLGVERWITRLTGAEAACVVNNGAAAILLVLSAVAAGRKVAVSRGELVEIGGSFRVPEIMQKSGATLVEVGATNRTHLGDYERAFEKHPDIGAILRVHRSNFRIEGFTAQPPLAELAKLAKRRRVPLLEDLGSGALVDLATLGLEHEPTVAESLAAGVALVTFSGDKLLGGAQAGFVAGSRTWMARVRKDPFARAMRADKLALAALEATLALYADPARARTQNPTLAMLQESPDRLRERADRLSNELTARVPGLTAMVVAGQGEVGGGALPQQKLPTFVVELTHESLTAAELDARARAAALPVIGTIRTARYRLDVRTLTETEVGMAATSLAKAWSTTAN